MTQETATTECFCTACGSTDTEHVCGVFVEIGEYEGSSYESEGDADGMRCTACGNEFIINGPGLISGATKDMGDM